MQLWEHQKKAVQEYKNSDLLFGEEVMHKPVEYVSQNLGVPCNYFKNENVHLCKNGVLFIKDEYMKGIHVKAECLKRNEMPVQRDYEESKWKGRLVR